MKKYAVISLSGGMDSSTVLLHLLEKGYECTTISFDYNQKHKIELERAQSLVEYINNNIDNNIDNDTLGWTYPIKHQIIKLDGLSQLLNSTLVEGGSEVPEGHYAEENMRETVVENRNKIFSSITQAVALAVANKNNTECVIALGLHSGDHKVYLDTTEEFRLADLHAFKIGNWNSDRVDFYTPYMEGDKTSILRDGEYCCEKLGLDFNEVYSRTMTSYKPIFIPTEGEIQDDRILGKWYSDYKSASSVERIEAFIKLGRPDPVDYADETGPVTWETARIYVEQVLSEYEKEQLNIN
jgi:7-cyano-7-deazaguanine synthase